MQLADIYGAISYYLHRHTEVLEYLKQRQIQASQIQAKAEVLFDPAGVRARLLARRTSNAI